MASNVSETSEDTLDLLSNDELDAILASLDFDLDTEEDRKVKCSFCEKICASQRGLNRHLQLSFPMTMILHYKVLLRAETFTCQKKREIFDKNFRVWRDFWNKFCGKNFPGYDDTYKTEI